VVQDYFQKKDDVEALERLGDIQAAEVYERTNFIHLLGGLVEEQNKIKAVAALKEAQDIITKGITFGEGRKQIRKEGIKDAITHASEAVFPLVISDQTAQTRGDVRFDTKAGWEDYLQAKHNKDKAWGRFTGLECIDTICHGHKRGELWVHAAFTGELKTMFAINWAYNLITRYRTNVLYISLEMPYVQIRRMIQVVHSANLKWKNLGRKPLDYRKVRDGELSPEDELFLKEVLDDLRDNPEYCAFDVWSPDRDITIDDIRTQAEIMNKHKELGFLVIDHGSLVEPKRNRYFKDYTIALNSILRDSKKLALQFNHGEGLPVLMLFQINRQGKNEADKAEGRYKISALAYSNEADRSADVITTTYLNDEHRDNNTTLFSNLKNRDNPLFKPFQAAVDFTCRRIYHMEGYSAPGMSAEEHVLNSLSDPI
jgi:replicative DNA helicase